LNINLDNKTKYIFLGLIFLPKIPIFSISGISSPFRVDLIFGYLLIFFLFISNYQLVFNFINKKLLAFIFIIFFIFLYIINSPSPSIALAQILLYISFICSFVIGVRISDREISDRRFIKKLAIILWIIVGIHLMWIILGINDIEGGFNSGLGQDESYILLGKYGTTSMPFQFSIYCASLIFYILGDKKNSYAYKIISIIVLSAAMVLGDSRISLGAISITIFGFNGILFLPLLLSMLMIMPVNQKMTDILALDFNSILSDPSLGMRIYNINNYIDWLNYKRIIFGGGAQSFLEFSSQYSMPGPLDMGYIRLVSEFGVFGVLFLIISLALVFNGKLIYIKNKVYFRFFIFLLIYTILNEGIFASKSGNLTFFMLGYFFFKFRNE
jgi:hypothetical protein